MIKKIIAILIIAILVIQIPAIEVKASQPELRDPGNDGGGYSGWLRGAFTWNSSRSGYRFTIVDSRMRPVSNVVDILFSSVRDGERFGDYFFTASRAHSGTKVNVRDHRDMLFSDLVSRGLLGANDLPPLPICFETGTARGTGDAFKTWFMSGEGGISLPQERIFTPPAQPQTPAPRPPATPSVPAPQPTPAPSPIETPEQRQPITDLQRREGMARMKRNPTLRQTRLDISIDIIISHGETDTFVAVVDDLLALYDRRLEELNRTAINISYARRQEEALRAVYSAIASRHGDELIAIQCAAFTAVINRRLGRQWTPSNQPTASILLPMVPLSAPRESVRDTEQKYDDILELRDSSGELVFRVQGRQAAESNIAAMVRLELSVIVEPIFWFVPGAFRSGAKASPIHSNWVYGTWRNHLDFQQSTNYRFGTRGGAYGLVVAHLGYAGMRVSESTLGMRGADDPFIRQNLNILFRRVNRNNEAIGIHVYSANPGVRPPEDPVQLTGDFELRESQITRAISTLDTSISSYWGQRFFNFTALNHDGCPGHWTQIRAARSGVDANNDGDYTDAGDTQPRSAEYDNIPCSIGWGDSSYRYQIHNERQIPPIMVNREGAFMWRLLNNILTGNIGLAGGTIVMRDAEKQATIWRHRDIPTIALYKNQGSAVLRDLIGAASNVPRATSRVQQSYTENLAIQLAVDVARSDLNTHSKHHGGSDSIHVEDKHDFNRVSQHAVDTVVRVHAEQPKQLQNVRTGGNILTRVDFNGERSTWAMAWQFRQPQEIRFHPYVRMRYQTTGSTSWNNVYILAERESRIQPNDAAEVAWRLEDPEALKLSSTQWSTHARATRGDGGWQGVNQVLPGGAMYHLATSGETAQVKIITWQTIVDDPQRQILSVPLTGDVYTVSRATAEHQSLLEDARESMEGIRVVKYITTELEAEYAWEADDYVRVKDEVESLAPLGFRRGLTSELAKHRLQNDGEGTGADEGDLDILSEDATQTEFFKIFADVEGDVYLLRSTNGIAPLRGIHGTNPTLSGGVTGARIMNRTMTVADITNQLALDINRRTNIITNFVGSLERNRGSDPTATPAGAWYNEAWDGIYLMRQATRFELGFGDPEVRASFVDPRLTPVIESRADLFRRAHLAQFRTSYRSTADNALDEPDWFIGRLGGGMVYFPYMEQLFQSRRFYIPNATVQDLN